MQLLAILHRQQEAHFIAILVNSHRAGCTSYLAYYRGMTLLQVFLKPEKALPQAKTGMRLTAQYW